MKQIAAFALALSGLWSFATPGTANAAAAPGSFTKISGHVLVESGGAKSDASASTELNWGDHLTGDGGSAALIHLPDEDLSLVGPFELVLRAPEAAAPPVLKLLGGKLRMLFTGAIAGKKAVSVIETPSSVMGVRGTDFFASYEPLLGESEVICFEHEIAFRGTNDKVDVRVTAGHWGGIGGRFGSRIKPPMKLPENVLAHFRDLLPLK